MTKLEEVARALYAADAKDQNTAVNWTRFRWTPNMRAYYFPRARAAIEALLEPTEMQAQIARHYFGLNPFERTGPPMNHTMLAAYRAMIDAILSEGDL